jgi:hypothetical protein
MHKSTGTLALAAACLLLSLATDAQAGPRDKRAGKDRDKQASNLPQRDASAQGSRAAEGSKTRNFTVPEPNPAQQANLQELRGSLSVLAGGAQAAEDEIRGLAHDLQGMALHPPDAALTQALATDLANAMADSSLSPREMTQLTQDVYAVLNSAGLSQSELDTLKHDIEAVLSASGVDRSDVQAVADDLQAIYDASQGSQQQPEKQRRTLRGQGA